jgi:outer membrane protein assembly factor BamD (BamD/ComL family)
LDLAEQIDAGKRLEYAKMFINVSRKITTPRNGIKTCREILEKYPNTEYSEKARMLLREVPERFRKRYGITNEEMGL